MSTLPKFQTILAQDPSQALSQRSFILFEDTKSEQEELLRTLRAEKRVLDMKILNLVDLSPENRDSLRPGGEKFSSKNWVKEMQNVKIQLLNKQVEIQAAEETLEEWFLVDKIEA